MRTAIYARYSSELQNRTSIDDQTRQCRERVERDGGVVVEVFADYAISGGSSLLRPQFQAMLAGVQQHRFDCIIADALDRYSRNLSDTNDLYELCKFNGVKMTTVDVGEIGLIHVGMQGTMSALFLQGLAAKVKSGQRGAFERGLFPGGKAYGYKIKDAPGTRTVDESQAEIIRRIFSEYNSGLSPRVIAKKLNTENVPSPTGKVWLASMIIGSRKRGNGIFHNALYNGELVVNRQKKAKNPATGKNVMQDVSPALWLRRPEPSLRIVPQELWDSVQRKIDGTAQRHLSIRRPPPRLLSGLVRCACCNGPMTVKSNGRLVCTTAREIGSCDHRAPIAASLIENRVVTALQTILTNKDFGKTFSDEYRRYRATLERQAPEHRAALLAQLSKAEKGIAGLMKAIEDGLYSPDMKARLDQLTRERDQAARAISALQQEIAVIYPNMEKRFDIAVAGIGNWLSTNTELAIKAKQIVRDIVQTVYVYKPSENKSRHIEFTGTLSGVSNGSERALPTVAPFRWVA